MTDIDETLEPVEFRTVTRSTKLDSYRRPRRAWGPVLEALRRGKVLFLTDEYIDEGSLKYLTLALARERIPERLRSRRTTRHGQPGRTIWLQEIPASVDPTFEEVEP